MGGRGWRLLSRSCKAFAADPEEAMFARLFRRLLFWYCSLLAVLVVLLVLSIGTTVPWLVFVSTEHDLFGQVSRLVRIWQGTSGKDCPFTLPGQGYMLACYDMRGRLLKSFGVKGVPEEHFLGNSLALTALHEHSAMQDALDQTGTEQVQFDIVFISSGSVGMVRQAVAVRKSGSDQVLGVVQLGTTPARTLTHRAMIVNIFFVSMFLALLLGGRACLRVSDTGIGIAPTDLPRLGERFYRVDKAHSRESGGNGLGLSIARGIVAAHRGALTLTSEPGKGTIATLLLPIASAETERLSGELEA